MLALAPSEVKRAMTGNGAAGKAQVQRAVQTLLGLSELPRGPRTSPTRSGSPSPAWRA